MGEAYKRMLRNILAGKEEGTSPFQGSPEAGGPIGGIEALGLTPGLMKEFYGTTLTELEKARKAPFEELAATSLAEAHSAQAKQALASTLKTLEEAGTISSEQTRKIIDTLSQAEGRAAETKLRGAQTEEAIEDNLYDRLSSRYTKALARSTAFRSSR